MQPPTREDWITGIREAVDSASPGSDSDPENEFTNEKRKSADNKYLRLRRLTAELRSKDIELSRVLESKMKIMNEILEITHGENYQPPVVKPDYIGIVREKKVPPQQKFKEPENPETQEPEVSKEQLLATVQVKYISRLYIPTYLTPSVCKIVVRANQRSKNSSIECA